MKRFSKIIAALALIAGVTLIPTTVFGQVSSDVTQQIDAGTLSTAILDGSRVVVPSPSFTMSTTGFSFDCQTSTGTLGSSTQRLYVINPDATTSGQSWNLSLAATADWTDGANSYTYNDPANAGCDNGQLTVDPSVGTVTADCSSTACTSAVVTRGSSTAITGATPVNILTSAVGDTLWRGYITGIDLSQEIPGETPAGNYTLPVTLTVVAS
jgi:hypothetical protein